MATPIVMPRLGDFMTEGTVVRLAKSAGESVDRGEVIVEIESEKLNYDLEAIAGGVFHPIVSEGTVVPVDGVLAYLLAEGEAPPEAPAPQQAAVAEPVAAAPPPPKQAPAKPAEPRPAGEPVPSTPGARRLAAKLGVDISQVAPTGPRGRVVEADVRAYAEQQEAASPGTPAPPPGLPAPSKVVALEGMRKGIADHMKRSLSNTAQMTFMLDVDVTEAQRIRKEVSRDTDSVITITHILIKACSETIEGLPQFKTMLRDGNLLSFEDTDMGVAVALSDGLIVPIIRQANRKDIFQISHETHELAVKAREGKLVPDDVIGGTFTISVLGTADGFTPILNQGQSAIMGCGRTVAKPVVRDGEVVVRQMMTISLTLDHQVLDGSAAAAFLRRFEEIVEEPGPLFR